MIFETKLFYFYISLLRWEEKPDLCKFSRIQHAKFDDDLHKLRIFHTKNGPNLSIFLRKFQQVFESVPKYFIYCIFMFRMYPNFG
jgi:hypothetical protein